MAKLAGLVVALGCLCTAAVPAGEYRARREALRRTLSDGVILLAGATQSERGDPRSEFLQESNFLYLTGWREPGAVLVMSADEEALYLPKRNEIRERYTGRKTAAADREASSRTGFEKVYEETELAARVAGILGKVYTVLGTRTEARARQLLAGRDPVDAGPALGRLRMEKSAAELKLIERSVEATIAAHRAAWRRVRSGLYEYQVAATMTATYLEQGCERSAYSPIVAAGPNAVVLHYTANRRRMDQGELLLMDVGAECGDYAADLTRTIPVSGKFTPRQREIYEIVLGAEKAAIAAAKPGMKLAGDGEDSLNMVAKRYVEKYGMGNYYLHGIGHHVGLDVHDASERDAPLKPGMVITIEPGLYLAQEGIGVRIEDMVLITETGARVLSAGLEREVKDIERALAQK